MGVGLIVGEVAREVGSSDFLKGFFSTISFYLEPNGWGTRFPEIMIVLYQGRLDALHRAKVAKDLLQIRHELNSIQPAKIIWDIDRPDTKAPWGDEPLPEGIKLSDCFITSNGKNLFDVLAECLEILGEKGGCLTIEPY